MIQIISKNFAVGELIKDPFQLIEMASKKQCFYHPLWGMKPTAILMSMHFSLIMREINQCKLFKVEKVIYPKKRKSK